MKNFITKETSNSESKSLTNDFYTRNYIRVRLKLGEAIAILEKKESMFLFWSYWKMIEFTNMAYVVQEWMTEYFDGVKLWNGDTDEMKKEKHYKHGPLGCKVDDLNPANAVHYCSICGAIGTYDELKKIKCSAIKKLIKEL